ncbi:hypothetical protein [Haloferax sulfurifontis]|nr:hypothetical protein [Haloferax sulfurifontis]
MALHDSFDYWSLIATFVVLVLVLILVLAQPPLSRTLALLLGVAVFAAGMSINIREGIPSYNRLLGVYIGIFGLAEMTSEGWNLVSAALVVIGSISVLELAYERVTGRSADIV